MSDGTPQRTRYLVELAAPEASWTDIERMLRQARANTHETGAARFIRSIFVPEDSRIYLLYEAPSGRAAAEAAAAAQLVVTRTSKVLRADGANTDGGPS